MIGVFVAVVTLVLVMCANISSREFRLGRLFVEENMFAFSTTFLLLGPLVTFFVFYFSARRKILFESVREKCIRYGIEPNVLIEAAGDAKPRMQKIADKVSRSLQASTAHLQDVQREQLNSLDDLTTGFVEKKSFYDRHLVKILASFAVAALLSFIIGYILIKSEIFAPKML